jgi:hypothetical protein
MILDLKIILTVRLLSFVIDISHFSFSITYISILAIVYDHLNILSQRVLLFLIILTFYNLH